MTTPDPFAPPPPSPPAPTEPYQPPAPPASEPAAPVAAPGVPTTPSGSGPAVRQPQGALVLGVILVLVGGAFLVGRVFDMTMGESSWPLWIILPGLGMLIASFAIPPRGGLGLAIPGAIIATVGGILWVQERYDVYETWAYAWALVAPTAPGVATLLYGLVKGDGELVHDGLRTTLVGLGLFAVFALFFEGVVGLSGNRIAGLDDALPVIVIGLGVLLVVLSLFGRREKPGSA